ncbi:hypothetical protein Sru01_24230 [Sphaerisporangium rufum]|uniref:SRPBCC family protein n=1 Tax=Sphaerisporangium rufum TaxID=1381558 RepID=A0A919UXX1_9ACTN|nr:SRPBCC family protein [Sphaerisporangium rufum]GII77441.1 hypothetical protein Sru01_24230 [Sphaerisporangium rufum]
MVHNVHERRLPVPAAAAGELIDSLAGPDDRLWPRHRWPAMRFDRPLGVGAAGGHGPVRYTVEEYRPGGWIRFRFSAPAGFHGYHEYEVIPEGDRDCRLRHRMEMTMGWPAWITYPLFYRPLHDALIEDSLDVAEAGVALARARPRRLGRTVRVLRSMAGVLRGRVPARSASHYVKADPSHGGR